MITKGRKEGQQNNTEEAKNHLYNANGSTDFELDEDDGVSMK